jgi:hypothetical protein
MKNIKTAFSQAFEIINNGELYYYYNTYVATLALGSRPRLRGLQGYGPRGRKPGN